MLMPKKNRIAIYELLFKEGVMVAKKDVHLAKHPELADKNVPNLHVMKAMQVSTRWGYSAMAKVWCTIMCKWRLILILCTLCICASLWTSLVRYERKSVCKHSIPHCWSWQHGYIRLFPCLMGQLNPVSCSMSICKCAIEIFTIVKTNILYHLWADEVGATSCCWYLILGTTDTLSHARLELKHRWVYSDGLRLSSVSTPLLK